VPDLVKPAPSKSRVPSELAARFSAVASSSATLGESACATITIFVHDV